VGHTETGARESEPHVEVLQLREVGQETVHSLVRQQRTVAHLKVHQQMSRASRTSVCVR
jgi:hypothetical protein